MCESGFPRPTEQRPTLQTIDPLPRGNRQVQKRGATLIKQHPTRRLRNSPTNQLEICVKSKSGPPNCMSKTRLCLTLVLGTCQAPLVGNGAPLRRTLQIRCQNAKFRFRKRPCPRLCGKARNPSRCTARSCHVKAFNCPPDAQITSDGAKNYLQAPPNRTQRTTNQPTNPRRSRFVVLRWGGR